MQQGARIGTTITIKGEIASGEPLWIAGRVEGRIDAPGHAISVEPGGRVAGDLVGTTIAVAGSVEGALVAKERIQVRSSATVAGDLSAPALLIEDGARVSGKLEIAGNRRLKLAHTA